MVKNTDDTEGRSPAAPGPAPGQETYETLEKALTHFVQSFESSAQRWEENVVLWSKNSCDFSI